MSDQLVDVDKMINDDIRARGWRRIAIILACGQLLFFTSFGLNLWIRNETFEKLNKQSISTQKASENTEKSLKILQDASGPDVQEARNKQIEQLLLTVDCNNREANKEAIQAVIDAFVAEGLIAPFTINYRVCEGR